jgi:hypothetical protein
MRQPPIFCDRIPQVHFQNAFRAAPALVIVVSARENKTIARTRAEPRVHFYRKKSLKRIGPLIAFSGSISRIRKCVGRQELRIIFLAIARWRADRVRGEREAVPRDDTPRVASPAARRPWSYEESNLETWRAAFGDQQRQGSRGDIPRTRRSQQTHLSHALGAPHPLSADARLLLVQKIAGEYKEINLCWNFKAW